jgi:hypothetical protein
LLKSTRCVNTTVFYSVNTETSERVMSHSYVQRIYQPTIVMLLQVFLIIGVTFQSRRQTAKDTDAENVEC